MSKTKYDFSGYATKNDLKCSDGRVILKDAFKHQDGITVPLVWAHLHNDPENVLGHAVLENRVDGVYCYGKFNESKSGTQAKELVAHGDVSALSIYANQLKEQAKRVMHGSICEVSLVLSGANKGAVIDNVAFAHGDGTFTEDETEAIIYTGLSLTHSASGVVKEESKDTRTVSDIFDTFDEDQKKVVYYMISQAIDNETAEHASSSEALEHAEDATVGDIFDAFSEDQKKIVYYLIGQALEEEAASAKHSDIEEGENNMKRNAFAQTEEGTTTGNVLSHDQLSEIVTDAKRFGSLKESFIAHAAEYGFDPIDVLFPDARDVNSGEPALIARDTTWVDDVLASTNHTPFARIRTRFADITAEAARAKGYVTGHLKTEQVIALMKRETTPTTAYAKQKLERDDLVDITDFDVVVWMKKVMRGLLNEDIARAVLISDGRSISDPDKINEQNVRPIAMDDGNVFVHRVSVAHAETTDNIIDEFVRARKFYKGSGVPALYVGTDLLTEMLLLKDQFGHRLYKTVQELASVIRVSKIIEVEPMNGATRTVGEVEHEILGIVVNLKDYTIGADKGGQVAMFDDFDIDYNQYKYLIETRISGALTMPKSALIIERLPAVVGT